MGTTRTVELSNFSKELDTLGKFTIAEQKRAMADGFARAIPLLVARSPVDTGLYAQSWGFTVDEKKAVIGNWAPQAAIIEYGARPFSPPLAPLLAWAKRVLKDSSQPPEYSKRVRELAWGTRNKIREQGIQPKHILENALPEIFELVKRSLEHG